MVEGAADPTIFSFSVGGLINPKTTAPTESFRVTQYSK